MDREPIGCQLGERCSGGLEHLPPWTRAASLQPNASVCWPAGPALGLGFGWMDGRCGVGRRVAMVRVGLLGVGFWMMGLWGSD